MSSTNRGAQRIEQDKYYTPLPVVDALLGQLDMNVWSTFMEPCRGGGVRSQTDAKYFTRSEAFEHG